VSNADYGLDAPPVIRTRVLRPGGRLISADIRHLGEYASALRTQGLDISIAGSRPVRTLLTLVTWGALRPGVVHGQRPDGSLPAPRSG
jgi:hypothetical protein